jgi:fibronectin type 3 domain-containing protein
VHFVLEAGEAGGAARLDLPGLFTALMLFDDGSNGDRAAGNGVYERDYMLPAVGNIAAAILTGRFTDDAGNEAAALNGARTFTLRRSPDPVALVEPATLAVPPDPAAVTLRWTQAAASEFTAYQVFRSESMPVDSTARLVGTVTNRSAPQFADTDVIEGRQYFYRVYVVNAVGLQRGSANTLGVLVPNERPPREVSLDPAGSVGSTRLSLHWSRAADRDFAAYLLYRNETGAVTPTDSLICRIADVNQNYWTELGLTDDTSYHYRVFVEDTGPPARQSAPSNEITATTTNEPPADVLLLPATDVTSIAATLHWEASADRSFAFYRLYRSDSKPVSTATTLVAELDERDTTSYRDTAIDPGMTYFYRLFVADEQDAISKGSNTIEVTTPD